MHQHITLINYPDFDWPLGHVDGGNRAKAIAMMRTFDSDLGAIEDAFSKAGILDQTLFVITADENDHFVGGAPSPAGCDGVHVPCTYKQIGEVSGNLTGLLATQQGNTTPFKVHADAAPVFYITGNPARDAAITRDLERAVNKLTAVNPYTGKTDTLTKFLADEKPLVMIESSGRTPCKSFA